MHLRTICLLVCTFYLAHAEVDIITEPRPGEEYVLVSSGQQTPAQLRTFETSHKIPEKHPQHRIVRPAETHEKITKKFINVKPKYSAEGIVAIEEDKKAINNKKIIKNKVADAIVIDVPVSKIEDIKIKESIEDIDKNPDMVVDLEALAESGKLNGRPGTTTQKPFLTTAAPTNKNFDFIPINFDAIDDINSGLLSSSVELKTAGSEQKQHSRIQIKKGPNGQDYEYEYIYYYYDEDEDPKNTKTISTTTPVHNSHDGPSKSDHENQITKESKNKNRYNSIDRSTTAPTTTPAAEVQNEVLPTSNRGRQRGRPATPAPVEEVIEEDRLPSSTRFPPRGRGLSSSAASSTTHVPEVSSETTRTRGRSQSDSVADESSGQSRSRTRAHIRRPSSELVDLDSFKTHSGDIPSQYKELPSRYSSESRTTTEVPEIVSTERELTYTRDSHREGHNIANLVRVQEVLDDSKLPADYKQTTTFEPETTEFTTMAAMEKVALDLYAYLAGENLNNEISPASEVPSFDGSTTTDDITSTTDSVTTEEATTPTTTTSTTTTTTTTTPAPTTTTTTPAPAPTRPSRFKTRPGARGRVAATSTTTEAPQESSTRARGRFGKPISSRKSTTTAAAAADSAATEAPVEKPVVTKASFGRRGLFAGRTRPSPSTASPALDASSETPVPRPRLRPNLRRTTTTSAPSPAAVEEDASSPNGDQPADTTPTPVGGRTIGRPGVRPVSLRPGARINLRGSPRLRPAVSLAPEAASEAPAEPSSPEAPATEADQEGSSATPAPELPRNKLRNRLQVSPSPKPKVAVTSPPRRPNPLLRRKQVTSETTTEATKKPTEVTEESTSAEKSETETESAPTDTTPAPPLRGLDALLARRRAIGTGRPLRPTRGAAHPK